MKVDLIISTYNNPKAIVQILSRIKNGSIQPNSVIIADDGSCTENQNLVKDELLKLNITTNYFWHEDKGFRKSKILNQSIRQCSGDYFVFLDGDCLPSYNFIKDHIRFAQKGYFVQGRRCFVCEDKVSSLLNGKTSLLKLSLSGNLKGLLKGIRFPIPLVKKNQTMYGLLGCNLGVWSNNLIAINGFDEGYEGWGREDSDVCARLYNLGLSRKMLYGRAIVYHLNHKENPRHKLEENNKRLIQTISNKIVECKNGIKKLK